MDDVTVIPESHPPGAPRSPFTRWLFLACLSEKEAEEVADNVERAKEGGDGTPRMVLFTSVDTFRRVLTPLRLELIRHLTEIGTPESIHELSRGLERDYHSILKDVQLLARMGVYEMQETGPKGGQVPVVNWKEISLNVSPIVEETQQWPPLPEETNTEEQPIPWDLWVEVVRNPFDIDQTAILGKQAYMSYAGHEIGEVPPQDERILEAMSVLLRECFSSMSEEVAIEVRESVEGTGEFVEAAMWEHPDHVVRAHMRLEQAIASGRYPTLEELLQMSHDLEHIVRPNLLRLRWICERASGATGVSYTESQTKKGGEAGSLGYAINGLRQWIDGETKAFLDPDQRDALDALVTSMESNGGTKLGLDEIRNWTFHRDFFIRDKDVIMNLLGSDPRGLIVPDEEVTRWRRMTLGLMTLLQSLKAMFLAHVTAKAGGPIGFRFLDRAEG